MYPEILNSCEPAEIQRRVPARVLIVDDNPELAALLANMLQCAGYEVETSENGSSAALRLAAKDFGVVVSDIQMPEMGGLEFLKTIRLYDPDMPVILMTGDPTVSTAISAVEFGALRYLVKPFKMPELLAIVSEAFFRHEVARHRRVESGHSTQLNHQETLSSNFNKAISTLWMAYQPIVSVRTKSTFAFEALLRSEEATHSNPGVILESAMRLGALPLLSSAVRERVARDIGRCHAQYVFINLHPRELSDEALLSPTGRLTSHAHKIVLEITERATLHEIKDVQERIKKLRDVGFKIAIDDLGAGYSGLTSIVQLQPDFVKLDMSLVRGLHGNETQLRLVESMSKAFRELKIPVIAEGVETTLERDTLAHLGCDLMQGYLFARPGRGFPTAHFDKVAVAGEG